MTCIAGVVSDGKVFIGGDSAASGQSNLKVRADRKVFRNGDFLIGFTSSFRMGQLLRHSFSPPDHPSRLDVDAYLCTRFVDAVRDCFKVGGYAERHNEAESGGDFLLGYRGRLFKVCGDYQVAEAADGEDAAGSGSDVAVGALFATRGQPPEDRILVAMRAAERLNAFVRGPFHVESA